MEQIFIDGLRALSASAPASMLRDSFWVYPIVNATHIFGIALLVGGILPLNLRLIGFIRGYAVRPLAKLCVPIAAVGLAIAVITGLMLFTVKPVDYVWTDIFLAKIGLIGLACINIVLVRFNASWREVVQAEDSILNTKEPDFKLRAAGAISLIVWIAVLFLGRFTGYFM